MTARFNAVALTLLALYGACAFAAGARDEFPPETATLRPSNLPGFAVAQQKCGICHSADYIELQPPGMTTAQWTAEMVKMQHTYGAPLDEGEIASLGEYLGVTYGGQAPSASAVVRSAPAVAGDAKSLLERNACLTCHAVDKKIVGPAYKDVAAKYRKDPNAIAHVTSSIRSGGQGKWGDVPMPPYPALSDAEIKMLAEFVLGE